MYGNLSVTNLSSTNIPTHDKTHYARYLVAGLSAVTTDLVTYQLLLHVIWPSPAKAASFLAATCVAYLLNKYWTFRVQRLCLSEVSRFGTLYGSSLFFNVCVNKAVIVAFPAVLPSLQHYTLECAWLCATGFSTVYNYLGQRFWVFRMPAAGPALNLPDPDGSS